MTTEPLRKTIFYSWQSDLPTSSNRSLIRSQLRAAINAVEGKHPHISLHLDEATRDLSGSPHIPTAITKKILEADFFVCDVSTINRSQSTGRRCPNPNVVFELGYAVATLGWGRIVLLTNTEFSDLQDLPFDFDRHRASSYAASEAPTAQQKKQLGDLLTIALGAMVSADPERPGAELTPEQKRRQRDVANLTELLSVIHIPTIDQHLDHAPKVLLDRALDFWEYFKTVFGSSRFHLYDSELMILLTKFRDEFLETVGYPYFYKHTNNTDRYIFDNPGDAVLTGAKEDAWNSISEAVHDMRDSFEKILKLIRSNYIEIDLEETSAAAWAFHWSIQSES